ncbi:MAG TPA: acetylglutamate kinase [Chitinophagaceae bacterium]
MDKLIVIKIGGNVIDDDETLTGFLKDFADLHITGANGTPCRKILVHGGGKLATQLAAKLGVEQTLVDGRRITDSETLKIAVMTYAGLVNKTIVARLQSLQCNAIGLSGADGDSILAHKRNHPVIDYGWVGDVDNVNADLFELLLEHNFTLVFAPITHDQSGQLLNTNADTIAQELAKGLTGKYDVELVYCFEKPGVLMNAGDESTVIREIKPAVYDDLKTRGLVFSGMIPKLDNAFSALSAGVTRVRIGKAEHLKSLLNGESGTTISL